MKRKVRKSIEPTELCGLALMLTLIGGWLTHVVISIQTASWILLFVGAIAFPVGIIHGIGSWFGAF